MKKINKTLLFTTISFLFLNGCNAQNNKKSQLIKKNIDNMVFVKGGSFYMGDVGATVVSDLGDSKHLPWSHYKDDKYIHKVTLSSFWMNKYETTYGDFDTYTELTNQEIHFKKLLKIEIRGANYPAGMSWYQANDYCQWLAKESGLPFALPTEAQWEYAARNRGQPIGYATNDGTIKRGVNYRENVAEMRYTVGIYPPNSLGLYDMSGNIFEWMSDWYEKDYYEKSPVDDPKGPVTGTKKVVRYGSHITTLYGRGDRSPDIKYLKYGVRCVINAETLKL